MLRNLESKIAGAVEGAFGRAFKSRVQPVELARKLAKEMDEQKTVSVSHTYVPNEYAVYLSPADREQFENYEGAMRKELSDYLLEHARREGLALVTRPVVSLETDERLRTGEFGIQAWMSGAAAEEASGEAEPDAAARRTTATRWCTRPTGRRGGSRRRFPARSSSAARCSWARASGPCCPVTASSWDAAGSATWWSTTPTCRAGTWRCAGTMPVGSRRTSDRRTERRSNGRRVDEAPLEPGDEVTVGVSRYTFEVE